MDLPTADVARVVDRRIQVPSSSCPQWAQRLIFPIASLRSTSVFTTLRYCPASAMPELFSSARILRSQRAIMLRAPVMFCRLAERPVCAADYLSADFVKLIAIQELSPSALARTGAHDHNAGTSGRFGSARALGRSSVQSVNEMVETKPKTGETTLRPRQAVLDMAPYHPPSDGRRNKLRLDFNENTVGGSAARARLHQALPDCSDLTMYPEYGHALQDLSSALRGSEDELTLTNGTDEAIQVLVNTYVDDRDHEVLLLRPRMRCTGSTHELAGANVAEVDYRPGTLGVSARRSCSNAITPETRQS